jgi:hypothetical protein
MALCTRVAKLHFHGNSVTIVLRRILKHLNVLPRGRKTIGKSERRDSRLDVFIERPQNGVTLFSILP